MTVNAALMGLGLRKKIEENLKGDGLFQDLDYVAHLPQDPVECTLYAKSDLLLAGLPFFFEVFHFLSGSLQRRQMEIEELRDHLCNEWEGRSIQLKENKAQEIFKIRLPFALALSGERLALNLMTRATSIATTVKELVEIAAPYNIKILDTRKTLPGLRELEKYATTMGGGHNHRLAQTDAWMIKDNHKTFFGGLRQAWVFFQSRKGFYKNCIVEIHSRAEWEQALSLGVKHVMLDNWNPTDIKEALRGRPDHLTVELSGGIDLKNIHSYLIEGVDAISVGGLLSYPRPRDLSLKMHKI